MTNVSNVTLQTIPIAFNATQDTSSTLQPARTSVLMVNGLVDQILNASFVTSHVGYVKMELSIPVPVATQSGFWIQNHVWRNVRREILETKMKIHASLATPNVNCASEIVTQLVSHVTQTIFFSNHQFVTAPARSGFIQIKL
jgi:hypothetical protein